MALLKFLMGFFVDAGQLVKLVVDIARAAG